MSTNAEQTLELDKPCPECGYDLRASTSERCPECGQDIKGLLSGESLIPWVHRARLGRVRAFIKTLVFVLFRPKMLASEIIRDVKFADARKFFLISAIASGTVVFAVFEWANYHSELGSTGKTLVPALIYQAPPNQRTAFESYLFELVVPMSAGWTIPTLFSTSAALWVMLASGVATYFFHPKSVSIERQNRALALSYCTAAGLLPACVIFAGFFVAQILEFRLHRNPDVTLFEIVRYIKLGALCVGGLSLVLYWWRLIGLYQKLFHRTFFQTLLIRVGLPVLWILCGIVALVVIPWIIGYARLMFESTFRS
jgi:hypothetical protein